MSDGVETNKSETSELGSGGDEMHIHRPKPLHGLRELLTEVGVIVIGIVIAIGMEQAVEHGHRANELREAREALTREHAYNLAAFEILTDERYIRFPLVKQNMALFSFLRDHPKARDDQWPYSWTNLNTSSVQLSTAAWQNAERNNMIQIMPTSEAEKYRREYATIEFINEKGAEELRSLYEIRRPVIEAGYSQKFTASEIDEELTSLGDLLLLYINVAQRQRNLAASFPEYRNVPDDRISVKAAFNLKWLNQHGFQTTAKLSNDVGASISAQEDRLDAKFGLSGESR